MPENGWNEWSRHVLSELERLSDNCDKINEKLMIISSEIASLKVKAGVWGALAGMIPVTLLLIVFVLKRKIF